MAADAKKKRRPKNAKSGERKAKSVERKAKSGDKKANDNKNPDRKKIKTAKTKRVKTKDEITSLAEAIATAPTSELSAQAAETPSATNGEKARDSGDTVDREKPKHGSSKAKKRRKPVGSEKTARKGSRKLRKAETKTNSDNHAVPSDEPDQKLAEEAGNHDSATKTSLLGVSSSSKDEPAKQQAAGEEKDAAATTSLLPAIITAPLEAVAHAVPDVITTIPSVVAQKLDTYTNQFMDTMRSAVEQLESLKVPLSAQSAAELQLERDIQLLELYGRTADYTATAQRANALVWQHGLAADLPAAQPFIAREGELLAVDCASIVADLQRKVAAYEQEICTLKSHSLTVAVERHAQAAINRELQDVRLKKASAAIREENRFRKALALQTSKLSGLKDQIATAKRVTREMKHAHLAIAEEHFDFGNELLKIREEARILAIEDRDAHARHIYKTFQELLDESKNLKLTKGNERDELESLIRAFRQLDDLSTHQHVKVHETYFQPFAERLQQIQAVYRNVLSNEDFRTVGKLPDELFADITHAARYNVLDVEHQIRLEEEAHETLFKALRTTLDSLTDEQQLKLIEKR